MSTYPHIVHCPGCDGKIRVPALKEAKQVKCGHCQHSFRLEPTDVIIDVFPDLKDKDPKYWELARCGACNGRLRVPVAESEVRVRCGHCDASLTLEPVITETEAAHSQQADAAADVPNAAPETEPVTAASPAPSPEPASATSSHSSSASDSESETPSKLWERLIRWPLSLVLALLSFYLVLPYAEQEGFWSLVSLHTVVASLLGTGVVWMLSRRIFLFWDELLSRAFLFITLLFVSLGGGTGWIFIKPVQPLVAEMMAPVISLQNQLLGTSVNAATGQRSGQETLYEGIESLIREWRYSFSQDSSWDNEPMAGDTLRTHIDSSYVEAVYLNGRVQAVVTIKNRSNQTLKGITADVEFANSPQRLAGLKFVASPPLLPGAETKMYAPLTGEQVRKGVVWNNQSVDWVNRTSQFFIVKGFDTEVFNRANHFERNVDRWLAE